MLSFPIALLLAAVEPDAIRFEDVTQTSGIQFVHSFGAEKLGSLLESTGAGAAWFDFDNDGLQDLYLVSGKELEQGTHPYPLRRRASSPGGCRLYRNKGAGRFEDVTQRAGAGADLFGMGATAADYDNDGWTDLFVTGYGRAILYRNLGNGTFVDLAARAGVSVPGWSIGSAWLDYNRDGCVDLFVGRYVKFDPAYRAYYAADNYPGPLDFAAETNVLLRNNCNGTFADVSAQSGIGRLKGRAMGVTAADFDLDGFPDIYVANDKTENFLFHNRRDGTFQEIALRAGAAFGQSGENTSAMGPVFSDFDADGKVDLWVSDSKYNRLLRNTNGVQFQEVTERAGISQLSAQYVSWGTGVQDFDNDGRDDIFIVHGGLIHMIGQEHSVFRNRGGLKFEDVSVSAGPFFAPPSAVKAVGRGAAFADFDNDGRVDVLIVNLGGAPHLLRNTASKENHWIAVKLAGKRSNREGIGAHVEIVAGGRRLSKQRVAGSGYLSQDDGRLHFGLGSASVVDRLTVTWPSGAVQTIEDVATDRVLTIEER